MSTPTRYRKKPVTVDATRWFENGDHPDDRVGEVLPDPVGGGTYTREEGAVVRFFRRPEPEYAGVSVHEPCGRTWHDHGWIDTLEGGHTACPGDWIITGVQGERYPCKDEIFRATYAPVEPQDAAADGYEFRVTVEDLTTGETRVMEFMAGDYVLIPFAPCRRDGLQIYPKAGTHVITVKGRHPAKQSREVTP